MTETTTPPAPPWLKLAAYALAYARDRRAADAGRAVQAIADQYGAEVIVDVLCVWLDTAISHCGVRADGPVRLLWQDVETGAITDATGTPRAAVWAGRLAAARLAMDEPQFIALIGSVGSDEEWSANIAAVLDSCGLMMRQAAAS